MSIRIRLAKWLAPELTHSQESATYWENRADVWSVKAMRRGMALQNIIALKTPPCAHIGKRMADIAEAALSHPNPPIKEEVKP